MPLDYDAARELLEDEFPKAEALLLGQREPQTLPGDLNGDVDLVFRSATQAYREVLLGCILARIQDRSIDIRKPYVNLGANSFNGRTLDERVVNQFLHDHRIPSSTGPYLSTFRRSVQFIEATAGGLRDKLGYAALLRIIDALEVSHENQVLRFLAFCLHRFAQLREAANITLLHLQRISVPQYEQLMANLLESASGGRFPVFLVAATLSMLNKVFNLNWEIDVQGINVADRAAGASGDITVKKAGSTILAAEVTERTVDRPRVVTTFSTKISPQGLTDYLFFIRDTGVTPEALDQARQLFAQGHEVDFIEVKDWIMAILVTVGMNGREIFSEEIIKILDRPDTPRVMRAKWNEEIERISANG